MSERDVRAVVFDFGGVLITSINHQLGSVAETLGIDLPATKSLLMGPLVSGDHPWQRAERGEVAVAQIQSLLDPWAKEAGIELRGDEIDRLLQPGQYQIVESMHRRVVELRGAGLATALLTNTFQEFKPTMERDVDFDSFDAVVESFAVGARKPEPAIYEATEAALGVSGSEIVYLDDFKENLAVPRSLGWRTILVGDPHAALTELDRILDL